MGGRVSSQETLRSLRESCSQSGPAETIDGADDARRACERVTEPARRSSSNGLAGVGAGIVFDEHLLTDAARDQDYNGGGEITFSGRSGGPIGRALDRALGAIDDYPPKPCLLREDPPYSF